MTTPHDFMIRLANRVGATGKPHTHPWAVILLPLEHGPGAGYELDRLELPCNAGSAAPGIRGIIAGLREIADGLEAGNADILEPNEEHDPIDSRTLIDAQETATVSDDDWRVRTGCTTCPTEEAHEQAKGMD